VFIHDGPETHPGSVALLLKSSAEPPINRYRPASPG